MQITFNLDESLLKEALRLTKFSTQEELMNLAWQELIEQACLIIPTLTAGSIILIDDDRQVTSFQP